MGIYHITDPNLRGQEDNFYFRWDYLDEARQSDKGTVGWYVVKLADPRSADQVAHAIDAISFDSDHETKTESEQAFTAAFASQFGDIGLMVEAIMGAVFFTLVLLTGNTMAQAVRERIPELAVLKTLGFSRRSVLALVLAESVLLLALGGIGGLALAGVVVDAVRTHLPSMGPTSPMLPVGAAIWLQGIILMVVVGLVVGALPAARGMRLRIVDALSGR